MLKHNLVLIYRQFLRYKGTFLINLFGLAIGMSCALLIYLWVTSELSVNRFHQAEDRMYQVMCNFHYSDEITTQKGVPDLLAETMKDEIPAIEYATAITPNWFGKINVSFDNQQVKSDGIFAGADYFNIFSFDLLDGQPSQVLQNKDGMVISEDLAMRLFNTTENVIGKELKWQILQHSSTQQITGIFKKLQKNTTEKFDFIIPFEKFKDMSLAIGRPIHWGNFGPEATIVVKPGTDIAQLNQDIKNFIKEKSDDSPATLWLQPYADQYLYGKYENGQVADGRIRYVWLFSIIGVFFIFMACINFINLSTARATRKIKEIGIKKTIGASRKTLIFQHLGEAMIMSILSLGLALLILQFVLPGFETFTDKSLSLKPEPTLMAVITGITLLTGLLAGIYPAFYLSSFQPATVFRGMINRSVGEVWIRKGLVIFQFTLSVMLIISVLVVSQQIKFIQSQNLGYNHDNLIYFNKEGKVAEHIETFLKEVKNLPGVKNVTQVDQNMFRENSTTSGLSWEGKNPDENVEFGVMSTGFGMLETLEIPLVEGRSFSPEHGNEENNILLNQTAVRVIGLEDPIGKTLNIWGTERRVVGVVKDFHFDSFHEAIMPSFFWIQPERTIYVMARIDGQRQQEAINGIKDFYETYTGQTLEFNFLDETIAADYLAETRIATLSKYFAGLAIFISCLGLFGLAAFSAERRTKEIGIRKTLGATRSGIIFMLSKDFTKMVLTGILMAVPISYYFIKNWLDGFAYHIPLGINVFLLAGIVALLVAWITVGFQALRAASVNPINSLRSN